MNQVEKIRAALAGSKNLSKPEITAVTGKFGGSLLTQMVKRDELVMTGEGHKHTYRLNPNYQAAPRLGPPLRRRKPRKGSTVKRAPKAIKVRGPDLRDLALANLLAAGNDLRTAVREQVEEVESDALLAGALAAHERAADLFNAMGSA